MLVNDEINNTFGAIWGKLIFNVCVGRPTIVRGEYDANVDVTPHIDYLLLSVKTFVVGVRYMGEEEVRLSMMSIKRTWFIFFFNYSTITSFLNT